MLIDSHCHLDRLDLDAYQGNLDAAIQAAFSAGIRSMLCIGVEASTWNDVIQIAERYPEIYATVGIHPLYQEGEMPSRKQFQGYLDHPKVVALGETGLDAWYQADSLSFQEARFREHLRIANEAGLPVIVHTRSARELTIQVLQEENVAQCGGVLHCFTENEAMARQALDLGMYISISGIVSFRNAEELRDVVRLLPLDRLLIETDSPWLAPVPYRGKPNEPKYLPEVARVVADLKQVSLETLAEATSENFFSLFRKARQPEV